MLCLYIFRLSDIIKSKRRLKERRHQVKKTETILCLYIFRQPDDIFKDVSSKDVSKNKAEPKPDEYLTTEDTRKDETNKIQLRPNRAVPKPKKNKIQTLHEKTTSIKH